jgi:hypothetical protein
LGLVEFKVAEEAEEMRILRRKWLVLAIIATAAPGCSDDTHPADGAPAVDLALDGPLTDSPIVDLSTADADPCPQGEATAVGMLCVRGETTSNGEDLAADQPVRFQVYPKGCFSSACTNTVQATCSVITAGTSLTLQGQFCIELSGPCTLPDCSGAGQATCTSGALPAGDYTATLGTLSVSFTVPSTISYGGVCDGDQF